METIPAQLDSGATALAFSSGASAAQTALSLPGSGGEILVEADSHLDFRSILSRSVAAPGLSLRLVDLMDEAAVAEALVPGRTAMIGAECTGNPA
ncbi:PLP-dependent transferase [Falsirhodobacter sp. 1013]|uniref:PLP-dependent transferase n=1 Tax=Falsirhodobacter sp. 1013 TaxID=3417566 RepID=UPI003EBE224B